MTRFAQSLLLSVGASLLTCASPAVTVALDDFSTGGGSVSWSQKDAADGKVALTLKAKASDGWAFSGWRVNGMQPEWGVDARNPSLSGVVVATNAAVTASFVDSSEDTLQFDVADALSYFDYGEAVDVQLEVDSLSFPKLTFSGLPAGLSYDARTLRITGTANDPCWNTVVVTGVNESGYRFTQTFRSTVGDVSTRRLHGDEAEIVLGEYFHAEFEEMFTIDGERRLTTITGVPDGMTWNAGWDLLYGTPKKAGVYVIKALVKFSDGKSDTATFRLTVSPPDPGEYGVDVYDLLDLSVGDTFESGDIVLGTCSDNAGIMSVSGLPTGLSVDTWVEDDASYFGVVGTVAAAGIYNVKIKVADNSGSAPTNVVTAVDVIVSDTPYRYLKVGVSELSPENSGTVTGGGAISVVSGTSVSAKAAKGYVFAGWSEEFGNIADVGDGVDYRNPSIKFGADFDIEFMELYALFVEEREDTDIDLSSLEGAEFSFAVDGMLDEEFEVASLSLPTLKATGLPQGVSLVPSPFGRYRLVYDPATAAKVPSPGRYPATLTAKNKSGAMSSASFLVTVENLVDKRIAVSGDYGGYAPDVEIAPIDLRRAVDFSKGETLSVSGLPRGLSYNKSANEGKGIEANTITGVPTAPGYYTLRFTAKVVTSETTNSAGRISYTYENAVATSFLTVLPYPLLSLRLSDEALSAGNSVTGAGNYKPGSKVTLKAKAAKGWVFAGWSGLPDVDELSRLSPSLSVTTTAADLYVTPVFVPVSKDRLSLTTPDLSDRGFSAEFDLGVEVSNGPYETLVWDMIETVSYPTVKVSGLPSGVKFSTATFLLSGNPTKSGVYYVTVAAKNAGGYSFTRILRVAVGNPDGAMPEETTVNDAGIDFSPLGTLVTGTYYAQGEIVLAIGASPASGAAPTKASVTGVPDGLKATITPVEGGLAVSLAGTPTKVALYQFAVKVTYDDRKTLTSKVPVALEDGGSAYIAVFSADESRGTATGGGVYSAGSTVKLAAKPQSKCVFAGWFADAGDEAVDYFSPLAQKDGIDPRTASVSFPFRPGDFSGVSCLYAAFVASTHDEGVSIALAGDVWEIDPDASGEFAFSVDSKSLPVVSAKNMPKGVAVDLARKKLVYTPNSSVKSGIYSASLVAKNQSKASAAAALEIRVANRTTDMIAGLDPSMDAYQATVGVLSADDFIVPEVDENVKLSVSGLPSGLSFKDGRVTGLPKKPGVYTVTFTATSGSGSSKQTGIATVTITIAELPEALSGTFNGFVYDDSASEGNAVGTFTLTASADGKISGTMKTTAGDERFSATGWMSYDSTSGVASTTVALKGGTSLSFCIDSSADWKDWQLQGTVEAGDADLRISAQRNPFGQKDGIGEAIEMAAQLVGRYSHEGLVLSVQKSGVAKFSGKYNGRTVSGSTVLTVNEDSYIQAKLMIIDGKNGNIVVTACFNEDGEPNWSVLE